VRTALYRHFDAAGVLLYVGISNDALRRLCQHKDRSHWHAQIARVDVEWLPDRAAASAAESAAIAREKPAWNVRGREGSPRKKMGELKRPSSRSYDAADLVKNGPYEDRPSHPLVGMFFHTFKDGEIHYQAHVLSVDGDTVLAQMFSWLTGYPTNVQAFPKSLLYSSDCKLYPEIESWRDAADRVQERQARRRAVA